MWRIKGRWHSIGKSLLKPNVFEWRMLAMELQNVDILIVKWLIR
mgnify:CR=1 FL=1